MGAGADLGALGGSGKWGGGRLGPGAREGGSVGLAAVRKAGPNAFARSDEHASALGIVGKKMLNQVQAKIFQGLNGVLTSQGVHGVLHGVSRENIAIVALDVRSFKVPLEAYRQCKNANVVAALLLGNSQQMNSRTAIVVFSELDHHQVAPKASMVAEEILAQRRTPKGVMRKRKRDYRRSGVRTAVLFTTRWEESPPFA